MADLSTTSAAYDELRKKYDAVENSDYESQYDTDISEAVDVIKNAEDFTYDSDKDASYQAAKRQYEKGANQAMKNALASSAALTGGYNNSWGQTAAQQAYDDVMRDVVTTLLPQYEEKAYSRHQDKINQNYNLVSLLSGLDDRDYTRYSNDLAKEQTLLNLAASIYDSNRGYDYQRQRDAVADSQYVEQLAYQKQQDAYANSFTEREIAANEESARAQMLEANKPKTSDYYKAEDEMRLLLYGDKDASEAIEGHVPPSDQVIMEKIDEYFAKNEYNEEQAYELMYYLIDKFDLDIEL